MTQQNTKEASTIPKWEIAGDWIDVCSCNIPCPCTFAQPPTNNTCDVVFAYKIRTGYFGTTNMAGLKVIMIAGFTGNVWAGNKIDAGVIFDASANPEQRQALQLIFTGAAGGWMGQFIPAALGTLKGVEFAEISFTITDSLEH